LTLAGKSTRFHACLRKTHDTSGAPQWGKVQLECAVRVLGAKNILYGSSYPIRRDWYFQGIDFVQSLNISEEEKTAILGGNAIRLFKLK
jgi:uncharacterized protein